MTRKAPTRRLRAKTSTAVAWTLGEIGPRVASLDVQLRELRVQQAQTETHLATSSNQLARLAEANTRGYMTLIEHYNRLEHIVRAIAEGFAVVQADIDQIQKFVGRQTELLAEIKAATVAVPMTGPELVARVEEARRQTRQTVTVRGEERQASEFDPPGDRRARATDV